MKNLVILFLLSRIRSRIRIDQILRIRIRIRSMRIRNAVKLNRRDYGPAVNFLERFLKRNFTLILCKAVYLLEEPSKTGINFMILIFNRR